MISSRIRAVPLAQPRPRRETCPDDAEFAGERAERRDAEQCEPGRAEPRGGQRGEARPGPEPEDQQRDGDAGHVGVRVPGVVG
ncbi:hypothetical protein ACH35V_22395 [Actinomadura sp. 1N219]|uniref:hypothetical protein n=1 Tax=Actinomadura sp. 1N219 TaxID=3375152 RepID=UPI00379C4535